MKVSNAVLHTTMGRSKRAYARDLLTGLCTPPSLPYSPALDEVTTLRRAPPYTHYRVQIESDTQSGPVLLFRTGSVIRAGGQPLGTSVKLVLDTTRWLAASSNNVSRVWPAAMSCPNLVLFGALPQPPPAALAEHPLAHKSGRFPGTAIKLKRATPEVFDSGKFIVPGASSVDAIAETVDALAAVIDTAQNPERTGSVYQKCSKFKN